MEKQDLINALKTTDIKRVVIKTLNEAGVSRSEGELVDLDFYKEYIKINSLVLKTTDIRRVHESGKQIVLTVSHDTKIYLKKFTIKQLIYKHSSQLF